MNDLMARGMVWMRAQQRRCATVPAMYERADRGGGEPRLIAVRAVLGRPGAVGDKSVEPVRIDANDLDFLISAADLSLDGEPIEPRPDDRLLVTLNGRACVYEVLPGGEGPPWRWSDPQRTVRRVHARLVDEAPSPEE